MILGQITNTKNMNTEKGFLSIIAALVILTIGSIFLYEYKQDIDQQAEENLGGSYVQVRYGGTGTTTEPIDSNILIANSTGTYAPSQLTAGSNINISTSTGAVTISTQSGNWASSTGPSLYYENDIMFGTSTTSTAPLYFASSTGSLEIGTTTFKNDVTILGSTTLESATPTTGSYEAATTNYIDEELINYVPSATYFSTSTNLGVSADTASSSISGNYVKVKQISIYYPGQITVKFDIKVTSGDFYGRIYINGVAVGTERTGNSGSYATYSEDFQVNDGDMIQLYVKNSSGGNQTDYRNFRFYYDENVIINPYVVDLDT